MERHTKRDYWQQHITSWQDSGLSQKEYCHKNSIAPSSFCYWKSKISKTETTSPKFFPLALAPSLPEPSGAGLKLQVGSKDFQIHLNEDFSPTALKKLIVVLEQL